MYMCYILECTKYGYANDGVGLTYTGAIRVNKASESH